MPLLARPERPKNDTVTADVQSLREAAYAIVTAAKRGGEIMRRIAKRRTVAVLAASLGDDAPEFQEFWTDLKAFVNKYAEAPIGDLEE